MRGNRKTALCLSNYSCTESESECVMLLGVFVCVHMLWILCMMHNLDQWFPPKGTPVSTSLTRGYYSGVALLI